jgi:hypothetical protein
LRRAAVTLESNRRERCHLSRADRAPAQLQRKRNRKSVHKDTEPGTFGGYSDARTGFCDAARIFREVRRQEIADVLARGSKEMKTCLG